MKKIMHIVTAIVLVSFLSLAGCSPVQSESDNKSSYQTISSETAKKRLDSEKGIILVDVRTEAEYAEKHIPGSLLIPVGTIETQASEKLKDKDATIFVYCRSGNRSAIAAQALANMNYTNVFDLGGINNWPYKTETTSRPNQLPDITPTNESQKAEAEKVVKPLEQTNLDKVQQPAPTPQLPTKPAPKPTPQINVQIQKMLESINSERAKVGVAPLSTDIKVMEAARMKSEDMVKNNYFSHTSPTYGSPFDMLSKFGVTFQGAAENIAMNSSVEAAHAALMASEGHRKNILNASYSYIGIGITDSPRGKVFVQMFVKK
ncbi:rhodanese-like domain-containing protein [Desulfosporosinus sp.]|uniref:rhodanese-like domain-containing protein n=1 Tax=Desulfosporosinus sp. TaxID=157907 RepID=UPI0025B967AB|nr:rhodanese-like domain-containing protein [Desulfosporosinus sp.]